MKKNIVLRKIIQNDRKRAVLLSLLWIVLVLFVTVMASQLVVNMDPAAFLAIGPGKILLEMAITAGVCVFFYVFCARWRLSLVLGTAVLMLLSVVSSYVFIFRGTELMPLDLLSAGTAANVAGEYSFMPTPMMVCGLLLWILVLALGRFLPLIREKAVSEDRRAALRTSLVSRAAALVLLAALAGIWAMASANIYIETWANNGSKYNGFLLNFTLQMRSQLASHRPKGYSAELVRGLEKEYRQEEKTKTNEKSEDEYPDIILILEESFADFRKLGSTPQTKEAVTPFWDSLGENATKGYALCSVFGGGTANSEYEVLTGNTMGFLPRGATPYQLYIRQNSYAMPFWLRSLGYSCHATHPYLSSGWNRPKIYPLLGFDDWTFLEDYPQKDLIRDYVSDREMFSYLIRRYEERDRSKPFFLFGITMQNHGGYDYEGEGVTPRMELAGDEECYPKAEQYLGLIHESDKAIQMLIKYFEKVDHPVVVAIFGDHYPWVEMEYYEKLHGGPFDNLEEQEKEYTMPFVVWSNVQSPMKKIELTSLSSLSSLIYDRAGLPQPPYNRFLSALSEQVPAWNSQGYYSKTKGRFENYEKAAGREKTLLDSYEALQYNSLFDEEGRSGVFFPAR